jgi:trk system potassium uptake protein TrkH
MIISAFTTTGFQVVTSNQLVTVFSSGALMILLLLMAIGGSSGSTAGGMKLLRVGIVAKSLASTIKETLAPQNARVSVVYDHLGRHVLTTDLAKSAMTVSTMFVVTYVLGALAGIASGYDAISAIFDSVSMASNGGLSTGVVSSGMPTPLKLIYILEMWAGRLEFITLIALVVKTVASFIPRHEPERDAQ